MGETLSAIGEGKPEPLGTLNLTVDCDWFAAGEDGPSQMALEDLAMFRAIPNCTVFYPSDAVSTERAVELAANTRGMCFIRTTRSAAPVVYENNHQFAVGKANVRDRPGAPLSEGLFLTPNAVFLGRAQL